MAGRSCCRLIEGELFAKPFNWPRLNFKPRGQTLSLPPVDRFKFSQQTRLWAIVGMAAFSPPLTSIYKCSPGVSPRIGPRTPASTLSSYTETDTCLKSPSSLNLPPSGSTSYGSTEKPGFTEKSEMPVAEEETGLG